MSNISKPIIVEQTFYRSANTIWSAITEIDQMRQWFFENIPSFKPEPGFETQFNVQSGERNFLHLWKLIEVVPNKKISYSWKYAEYEGDGFVTFELFEQKNQTLLRLTAIGMETFPQSIPEFLRESCIAGWDYFIGKRLKKFLE